MAICLASTVWWTMQPKHGGIKTIRALPYGGDLALRNGELRLSDAPVVARERKPWRYS